MLGLRSKCLQPVAFLLMHQLCSRPQHSSKMHTLDTQVLITTPAEASTDTVQQHGFKSQKMAWLT